MSALQQMWLGRGGAAGGPGLFSWGLNAYGLLGLGNTTTYSSPKQVGSLATWTTVSVSRYHTLAVKTDGTLWSWGRGDQGELGLGNITNYSSPKQVGALTTWATKVAATKWSSSVIKTDGTLWSWGRNNYGQLGIGNITNYSSPKQVGALTTWSTILPGQDFLLAVKTDGTLWSWGFNSSGQLGLGDAITRSSPVQVGALTTWATVDGGDYHSLAIKTDGTLWSWGQNNLGQLGLGDTTTRSSPVQVGALTTWSKVAGGRYFSLAVKTDGTLWSWGQNNYGQLGLNGLIYAYSSPMQIGALTTWSKVSASSFSGLAIKTAGTLWSWGNNSFGTLGLNDAPNRSSPTQIGALTTWSMVSGGHRAVLAIYT